MTFVTSFIVELIGTLMNLRPMAPQSSRVTSNQMNQVILLCHIWQQDGYEVESLTNQMLDVILNNLGVNRKNVQIV